MSSIVKAVFQTTIGLLANKGRDWAARKLKEGDLTDEKFRSLIVREIDDIKSKLDGMSRKDLLASISFFKEGIVLLYNVFKNTSRKENCAPATQTMVVERKEENLKVNLQSTAAGSTKTISLAKELKTLKHIDLEESAREALSDAKKRFKDARRKATEAFGNDTLNTSDRILAMALRVMGTILEKVDNPANALPACNLCLEELHAFPAVQKCFKVEITEDTKGFKSWFKSWFKNDEHKEIIAAVCYINQTIYDVMQMVDPSNIGLLIWPSVKVGTEKLDPLRDARVVQLTQYMGRFPVPSSFGLEGEEEHKLEPPCCICTNKKEQFIVGSRYSNEKLQVFDCNGKFLHCFFCANEQENKDFRFEHMAIDKDDYLYLLLVVEKEIRQTHWCRAVYLFDQDNNFQSRFSLRVRFSAVSLTVEESTKQVFVYGYYFNPKSRRRKRFSCVEVYETNVSFLHSFGEDILSPDGMGSITAGNDGLVMVLDCFRVHVFNVDGNHLYQFAVGAEKILANMTFNHNLHKANEHVVYVLQINEPNTEFLVFIYTKDGELVNTIHLPSSKARLSGVTVTTKGRIAMLVTHDCGNNDDSAWKGELLVL